MTETESAPPVDSLSDDEILALCNAQLSDSEQSELSALLDRQREGQLGNTHRNRLDELMQLYRRGLLRKSEALKIAKQRKLHIPAMD